MTIANRKERASRVWLAERAYDKLIAAASHDLPNEAGGILVGWHQGTGIFVSDILTVADSAAGRYHFVRNHDTAEAVLSTYLDQEPDSAVGYVGEWHSHPILQPPSSIDYNSIRGVAEQMNRPVVMFVVAFDRDGSVSIYGVHAQRQDRTVELLRVAPQLLSKSISSPNRRVRSWSGQADRG